MRRGALGLVTKISYLPSPVCVGVAGSWRLWLQCYAQAAAALGETTRRRGHHISRVKVQGGWMRTWWADPPAGLPVLPGQWGTALRPERRGAGEAGEGADGSTHASHHPRAAPQPFASETHRWESQHNSSFLITSRSLLSLPGRGENETDDWLKLNVNFLCLPRVPIIGASSSKSSHTSSLSCYPCILAFTPPQINTHTFWAAWRGAAQTKECGKIWARKSIFWCNVAQNFTSQRYNEWVWRWEEFIFVIHFLSKWKTHFEGLFYAEPFVKWIYSVIRVNSSSTFYRKL